MTLDALSPWGWSKHTLDVLTAIGTVGAVVVVLVVSLMGWTWRAFTARRRRPDLELLFDPLTNLNEEKVSLDGGKTLLPAAYVRLTVRNGLRSDAAQGVQVLITRVERAGAPDPNEPLERDYEPRVNLGPLPWTHTDERTLVLGPGASRTIDLGYLVERDDIDWFTLPLPTNPFSGVQYLPRGPYFVRLAVAGANFVAKEYQLWLWHAGGWTSERPIGDQFGAELHSAG
jgi:hypothetical protein